MAELVHRHPARVVDSGGRKYEVLVHGDKRTDGTWEAWLEFRPEKGGGLVLRTDRETTQATRDALITWAQGLETAFLEGAFARAFDRTANH